MVRHDSLDLESEEFVTLAELPALPPRSPVPVYGSARFATADDLAPYLSAPTDEDFPSHLPDTGVLVENAAGTRNEAYYRRKFYLSADVRQRGVMILGQPGSYKTTKWMLPLAVSDLSDPSKVVVYPATKGNEVELIQAFVDKYRPGQKVIVLNLTNADRTTHAYNPFAPVSATGDGRDDVSAALDDAMAFVAASREPGSERDSPFWDHNAARFITAFRLLLAKKHGRVSPADVHHVMELPLKDQLAFLDGDPTSPFAANTRSYMASDGQNANTVTATALGFLRSFADWHLARTTGNNELSWEQLLTAGKDEPGAVVVLELDIHTLGKIRAVLNLLFLHLFRTACAVAANAPGCRLPRPLCVYLDDFPASVGRIPGVAEYFNTLRSRDCRLTVALQSSKQLLQYFTPGEADAIQAAFSTRVYCTPVDAADAEAAARAGGISTVLSVARTYRFGRSGTRRLTQETETPVARPLVTPEEVRLSPDHFQYGRACTVFLPNTPAARLWVRPAFEVPEWVAAFAKVSRTARRKTLRETPLTYSPPTEANRATDEGACTPASPGLPPGITYTSGWTDLQISTRLEEVKKLLDWDNATPSARKWWEAFEKENASRLALVLRLAEELKNRKATITEFFQAYVYSNTDNIQANLHYMDYTRLKKEEERKKKETAEKAKAAAGGS